MPFRNVIITLSEKGDFYEADKKITTDNLSGIINSTCRPFARPPGKLTVHCTCGFQDLDQQKETKTARRKNKNDQVKRTDKSSGKKSQMELK